MIITRLCYATAVWERNGGGSAALAGPRSVIREVDRPTLEHLLLADYKPQQQLQRFQLSFFHAGFCLGETWPSKRPLDWSISMTITQLSEIGPRAR